jgi:hypothetical protein
LDSHFATRELRIAHCRDVLLEKVKQSARGEDALYIPIDLDGTLAQSISKPEFLRECVRVASGDADAVFPISFPYYYDVFALRAKGWLNYNCWESYWDASGRGQTRQLLASIRHVYSKQKPWKRIRNRGLISVESAFGGLGIYRMARLGRAKYTDNGTSASRHRVCEHIGFNAMVNRKCISTTFTVEAPSEHLWFRLLPRHRQVGLVVTSVAVDLIALSLKTITMILESWLVKLQKHLAQWNNP